MRSADARWVRKLIYDLKRTYGSQPISIRRTINNAVDLDTGENFADLISVTIRKAGILPAQVARQIARAATDVNRDQDFTYGGFFDDRTKFFLVSQRDLPSDFPIDKNMHIVFPVSLDGALVAASRRFEVISFTDLDSSEALIIQAVATDGAVIDTTQTSPIPAVGAFVPPASGTVTVKMPLARTNKVSTVAIPDGVEILDARIEVLTDHAPLGSWVVTRTGDASKVLIDAAVGASPAALVQFAAFSWGATGAGTVTAEFTGGAGAGTSVLVVTYASPRDIS